MISARAFETGEEVTIAWRLTPGQPPFQVHGIVRHSAAPDPQDHAQTGLEFLQLTRDGRLAISHSISGARKSPPE